MSATSSVHTWFEDIRFWIILFVVIRLIGITNPPLEVSHNWRQTTVTMVARNFVEVDADLMHPRIDIAGEQTGITGMEFPLFNYLIYQTASLFGYNHWLGRIINLIVSSLGIFFFYPLVLLFYDREVALYASLVLLSSIWFSFSRKIMPDTFSVSLIIMSLYYGARFLKSSSQRYPILPLIACIILAMLGSLAKLPAIALIAVFGLFLLQRGVQLSRKTVLVIGVGLAMAPTLFWYFHWVPHLVEEYGFWHFYMGKSLGQGTIEVFDNLGLTAKRFYDTALKYSGFAAFLIGLFFIAKKRDRKSAALILLCASVFLLFIMKAGLAFAHHSYYIIPFVPIMALVAGIGLSNLPSKRIAIGILIVIGIEGLLNQSNDFRIKEKHAALLNLESDLDKVSSSDDLILINSGDYPTPMYFAHRKGWVMSNERIARPNTIDSLENHGLRYIIVLNNVFGTAMNIERPQLMEKEAYTIYAIEN